MNIRPITEWSLYRLRFVIAYAVLTVLAGALLLLFNESLPPGLGPSEQQTVVASSSVSFTQLPKDSIDLPYHALQKLSVEWFGITPLGVRLPSIVFGMLTALCMALLLRRWFTPSVALLGSIIFITSSWFLGTARLGSVAVMIPFWTSVLLLTATYVSQQTKNWKWWRVLFAMAAALSLYTPYMAYLFAAAALASLSQPHLRFLLRDNNQVNLFIGGFFFILLLVPLGWGVYSNPSLIRDLLAVPATLPDPLQFLHDFFKAASALLNPYNVGTTETITPALGVVSVALLLMGGARLLRDFHSVRAHLLLIWAALLLPVVGFNPGHLAVMLVPATLVVTIGLNQIIRYWYRLFPRNPYARLFGLLPLAVLVLGIVQVNYQRYVYGMAYSPQAGAVFVPDAFMMQKKISELQPGPATIVVGESDIPLYTIMASRRPQTVVSTANNAADRAGTWYVQAQHIGSVPQLQKMPPSGLLVSDRKDSALRFAVYQR